MGCACKELLKWPEGVLKILHFAFCSFSFIFMVVTLITAEDAKPFPDMKHLLKSYIRTDTNNTNSTPPPVPPDPDLVAQYLKEIRGDWTFCVWMVVVIVAMICSIVLLAWHVKEDPCLRCKKLLLIYYILAPLFLCMGFAFSVMNFINICQYEYCAVIKNGNRISTTGDNEPDKCGIKETLFFWMLILANLTTIGATACYVVSAVFHVKNRNKNTVGPSLLPDAVSQKSVKDELEQ